MADSEEERLMFGSHRGRPTVTERRHSAPAESQQRSSVIPGSETSSRPELSPQPVVTPTPGTDAHPMPPRRRASMTAEPRISGSGIGWSPPPTKERVVPLPTTEAPRHTQSLSERSATGADLVVWPDEHVTKSDQTNKAHQHILDPKPLKEWNREVNRRERIIKVTQTLSIHLSFFGTGMYYSLFGPTIQDLAVTLNVDFPHVLYLLAARGMGTFFGSVLGGIFLRSVNPQVLFVVLDFFVALACIGVSYFDDLIKCSFLFGLGGTAVGAINIVGLLWMAAIWRERSGVLLQTLSFMHSMGCVLGPVVGEPFLTRRSSLLQPVSSDVPKQVLPHLTHLTQLEDKDFIYVSYAYWVVGLYLFAIVFLVLAVFFTDPRHEDLGVMDARYTVQPCSCLMVVFVCYLATYVAMEVVYSQLVAPHALLMGHDKTVAAYVTSLFWAAFTAVRGVSILWVQQNGSLHVLVFCNLLLLLLAGLDSWLGFQPRMLWIGTALTGACLAPMLPSTLLLVHDYCGVSSWRFAAVTFAVGVSAASSPLWVGSVMEANPMAFHYSFFFIAALSFLLAIAAVVLVHRIEFGVTGYRYLRLQERRRSR